MIDKNPHFLLGIDPGKATGVVMIDISDPDNPVALWSAEMTVDQFHAEIDRLMQTKNLNVAIEDFRITAATGKLTEAPWSLKLIGVVEYLGWLYSVPVTLQMPSQKPFATNERLRSVDFWHVGGEGHANDAFRHAMIWVVTKNNKFAKQLMV